ncbi:MAG: acetyl-CoA carboxylase, carboxyltransferase subunit beta [Polyangiaceae bacterium]
MVLPQKTPAQTLPGEKRSLGQGMFQKCDACGHVHTADDFRDAFWVCTVCGNHHAMPPAAWRQLLLDDERLERWDEHVLPADPLRFDDGKPYRSRLERATKNSRHSEAVETGSGRMDGAPVAYASFIFPFMGGSMGSVVGERITRWFERALDDDLPAILLHASGGARMQEGLLSLMQMAKTVGALRRYRTGRRPYISVLVHPTTGGVAASTALLGDVNLAEPNALIGFAGPRVIESTLRTTLPPGFQRSEFLLSHGMVDLIVPRAEMKATLVRLLSHLSKP